MAKKTETFVTLTEDLDGAKADRTLAFSFDGTNYEIDLSKKNATAFEKAMSTYIGAARKVRTVRGRTSTGTRAKGRTDLAAVHKWAQANDYEVSERGRIAQAVQDAYKRRALNAKPLMPSAEGLGDGAAVDAAGALMAVVEVAGC